MKKFYLGFGILSLFALLCAACGSDQESGPQAGRQPDDPGAAAKGICGVGVSDRADADVSENPIVFADGNIEWFNPTTREIRFRDLEPAKAFVPYREIVFRLDDETLFAAATIVSDVNSQIYYDLVLYLSDPVEPRCYLNDAYPFWAADSDEARANAEARAEGWNKFLEHLRQDGRLQE
jgi:hypothetical protein